MGLQVGRGNNIPQKNNYTETEVMAIHFSQMDMNFSNLDIARANTIPVYERNLMQTDGKWMKHTEKLFSAKNRNKDGCWNLRTQARKELK